LTGPIESKVRKNSGTIKVMALEKKSDYGKTQAQFILSSNLNVSYGATAFLVINKFKSVGKY
jgi:hypothetical protein